MSPVRTLCRCKVEVLEVGPYLVDATELIPRHECKRCGGRGIEAWDTGRGRKSETCGDCGGTGELGEPIARGLVALDAEGSARVLSRPEIRNGEALHRIHVCEDARRTAELMGKSILDDSEHEMRDPAPGTALGYNEDGPDLD